MSLVVDPDAAIGITLDPKAERPKPSKARVRYPAEGEEANELDQLVDHVKTTAAGLSAALVVAGMRPWPLEQLDRLDRVARVTFSEDGTRANLDVPKAWQTVGTIDVPEALQ